MAIYDVTDLRVYQRATKALSDVYKLTDQIPKKHYRLRNQFINSSEAIPPLIAEGFAKKESIKEWRRFLRMAMGSSDETIAHDREIYLLSIKYKFIDKELCIQIGQEYKIISKQINKLISNWIDYKHKK